MSEESKVDNPAAEQMSFQAEVSQLLQLMIHSLYSNQEIFLRELISNCSDACDKLRFEAIADGSLLEDDSELRIIVSADEEAGTITVEDNGIGMNREEVIANIGTIAKSGTKQFLESLTGDQKTDAALIGQFGVGFYSAFVVADRVTLVTRRAGEAVSDAVQWESDASGGFAISSVDKESRGTKVILQVKDDCKEFVNDWRLRNIISKYSDHITFPIMMLEHVPPKEEGDDSPAKVPELEKVNAASALWTKPKADISTEDYHEFYKQICHDYEAPLAYAHNRVEGTSEYISLLYIPKKAPFDLYEAVSQRNGIKLFVQRVFIMDEAEKMMPRYLRFVRGLVDSSDLPLNVSREILQNNKVIDSIRRASIKKVLSLLEDIAANEPEKYLEFWQEFGPCLKEAPGEDFANKDQVAKLYRFSSTAMSSEKELTSLADYMTRMKSGQDKIYYITADSYQAAVNSPHLEIFKDKDIEVLLMHDRVDEWMMSYLTEFDGKSFDSIAKGDLDLSDIGVDSAEKKAEKEEKAKQAAEAEPLIKRIKAALDATTSDVRASTRLTSSPACVVLGEQDMALHMQQLMKQAGHELPDNKPVLEVNPSHPLLGLLDKEQDEDRFASWSQLLLDQALLADGGQLDDGAGFVKRMNEMFVALHENG
ncbi:MAG: molecular chaperone HtpG [Gammaproteobacteria bacterium]|nr:molecular chaperone HtpG [Gammaproteobacteria bacterium]